MVALTGHIRIACSRSHGTKTSNGPKIEHPDRCCGICGDPEQVTHLEYKYIMEVSQGMPLTLPDEPTCQKVLSHELFGARGSSAGNLKMVVCNRGCTARHGRVEHGSSCLSPEIGQLYLEPLLLKL